MFCRRLKEELEEYEVYVEILEDELEFYKTENRKLWKEWRELRDREDD